VLADFDNDADLDLAIANGHIYPQVNHHPELGFTYRQRNLLMANDGNGRFVDLTERAGPGFALEQVSRGLAAGDYDNDGDLDLLVINLDEAPNLLRNDSPRGNWLTIIAEIPPGDGPVLGTRAWIQIGDQKLYRDVASSDSYVSSHDPRMHFGLGKAEKVDRLTVRWFDGSETRLEDIQVNQFLRIRKEPVGIR